ncbi:c-type cytochrome [Larkinella soli]|uniref:c-type cytochrome n=1 Tax=Larkinella soli TaxID=1770527 RepID=UPI000FFB4484|nr:c-type cytochrome [Larkinella soli]
MKKRLKTAGVLVGAVLLLALAYYAKAYLSTEARRQKVYAVTAEPLRIEADSALLATGKRLVTVKACADCHGRDLSGKVLLDDPLMGRLVARNLTKGKGGLPADFDTEDWVMALRHGLGKDRKSLLYMPAQNFSRLSEADLKAIIAYCAQVPAVDRELPESRLGPIGRIMTDLDKVPLFPAELVDHHLPLNRNLKPAVTVQYGQYVAMVCSGCHQPDLKGVGPAKDGKPTPPDITSTGRAGRWTEQQFIRTLRTGIRPDGRKLAPGMPWAMTKEMTDTELRALHLYLKSV